MIVRTRAEKRKSRVRIQKRDLVGFSAPPSLAARLAALEEEIVARACAADPACTDFLEWWADEWKFYGTYVRPGVAALYWGWVETAADGSVTLDRRVHDEGREELAMAVDHEPHDGEMLSGRAIVQEFWWWSVGAWFPQPHVVLAIELFREFHATGRMKDWRRKKRRRQAAARRKQMRELQSQLHQLGLAGGRSDEAAPARPAADDE
jgi:hypothetical protein